VFILQLRGYEYLFCFLRRDMPRALVGRYVAISTGKENIAEDAPMPDDSNPSQPKLNAGQLNSFRDLGIAPPPDTADDFRLWSINMQIVALRESRSVMAKLACIEDTISELKDREHALHESIEGRLKKGSRWFIYFGIAMAALAGGATGGELPRIIKLILVGS
jgi:hypothetical protein